MTEYNKNRKILKWANLFILFVILYSSADSYADSSSNARSPTGFGPERIQERTAEGSVITTQPNYIEGGLSYDNLDSGFRDWHGEYFTLSHNAGKKDFLLFEAYDRKTFGQEGVLLGLSDTHIFNKDWYSFANISTSTGSYYWQKFSYNFTLYKRLLPKKQLVPYLGYEHFWYRTGNTTKSLNLGIIYNFTSPWIVEAGVYLSRSQPGDVGFSYQYISLTQGKVKKHIVNAYLTNGDEGYKRNHTVIRFPNQELILTWRQWISKDWGFNVIGDLYHSNFYTRKGITVGLFMDI